MERIIINIGAMNTNYAQKYTVFVLIGKRLLQIRHRGDDFVKFRTTQMCYRFSVRHLRSTANRK